MDIFGFSLNTEILFSQWKSWPGNDNSAHKSLMGLRFIFVAVPKEATSLEYLYKLQFCQKCVFRMKKLMFSNSLVSAKNDVTTLHSRCNISGSVRCICMKICWFMVEYKVSWNFKNFPTLSFCIKYFDRLWCYNSRFVSIRTHRAACKFQRLSSWDRMQIN